MRRPAHSQGSFGRISWRIPHGSSWSWLSSHGMRFSSGPGEKRRGRAHGGSGKLAAVSFSPPDPHGGGSGGCGSCRGVLRHPGLPESSGNSRSARARWGGGGSRRLPPEPGIPPLYLRSLPGSGNGFDRRSCRLPVRPIAERFMVVSMGADTEPGARGVSGSVLSRRGLG